jgi:Tol biopolymer transport system component
VYLCTVAPGKMGIWQIPLDGTQPPVQFRAGTYMAPSISPDGRLMKSGMFEEQTRQLIDVIFPMDGSAPPKPVPLGPGKPLLVQWTPDGKGLSYIAEENGVGNIYYQPWPSGKYRKLTTFDSDSLFYYDWAPGNRLIVARGTQNSDLVLLTNLKRK